MQVDVTLDDGHAAKLRRLAYQAKVEEETLAGSLLASALDEIDADPRLIRDALDTIPGAFESAQIGLEQARRGETVPLDQL